MKNRALAVRSIPEMTENRAKRCQLNGHSSAPHAPSRTLLGLLVLLIVLTGCGGGGGYNPDNVTVTVSPATATIPASGQVMLQATIKGLCSTCEPSIYLWYIFENNPANGGFCTNSPPTPQCPAGTIQEMGTSNLTATYNAPSTPGTYHVIAEWSLGSGLTQTGTSVVTVGP
jgi:hypothetical protein